MHFKFVSKRNCWSFAPTEPSKPKPKQKNGKTNTQKT